MAIKYNSPVILTFALLSTFIYCVDRYLGADIMQYFLVHDGIQTGNPLSLFTIVSHVLGHASLEHLIGNMTMILLLGPHVEEKYGSLMTFIMIVITALATGIFNIVLFNTGLYGASGVVFMLILLSSFTTSDGNGIPLTFILVAILFLGKEIVASLQVDGVAQFAHIIGGICGGIFGFIFSSKKSVAQ